MRVRHWFAAVLSGSMLLAAAGCDSAPGPVSYDNRPPVLSNLFYSPTGFVLSEVPPEQIVGERLRVPIFMSVTARDPDGRIEEVAYVVQSPLPGRDPLARGTLERVMEQQYEGTATVEIPVGEVGVYTVLLYAVDGQGMLGNQVRGMLNFAATGGAPVIESVVAEPEVIRPPTQLRLVVTVSDPDGLTNIARVVGVAPSGFTFNLLDDGRNFGDAVAGDGRYTARFDVPEATPGVQVFSFQAYDRTGLKSEVALKHITIE